MSIRTPRQIALALVAEITDRRGIKLVAVMSPCRTVPVVAARYEAFAAVANAFPSWSISAIARFFDRDHTTVIHCFRKHGYPRSGFLITNRSKSPRQVLADQQRETSNSDHSELLPSSAMKQEGLSKCGQRHVEAGQC